MAIIPMSAVPSLVTAQTKKLALAHSISSGSADKYRCSRHNDPASLPAAER